jgi:CBS domain-containing protein
MQVKEIMAQPVVTASDDISMEEVAQIIMVKKVGCVPLTDSSGHLSGIITMSDFAPRQRGRPSPHFQVGTLFNKWFTDGSAATWFNENRSRAAREIMSTPVISVEEDDDVRVAVNRMFEHGLSRLPVVRQGRPVGVVSQRDLLRVMRTAG